MSRPLMNLDRLTRLSMQQSIFVDSSLDGRATSSCYGQVLALELTGIRSHWAITDRQGDTPTGRRVLYVIPYYFER
jgi:hypothetical protein